MDEGNEEDAMSTTIDRSTPVSEGLEKRLTSEQVWQTISKRSFAVLSYVTPAGDPRSSGVMYKTVGHRLYVAVATDGWKAKHVARSSRVALTVPVRRGGIASLLAPIPPATISFHGRAAVRPAGAPEVASILDELGSMLPQERRRTASIIEIDPEGDFVTYGVGVSLMQMRDTEAARGRVGVS
jgi:hypothetical protein